MMLGLDGNLDIVALAYRAGPASDILPVRSGP